jgi:predicted KAP-like P-loop ATPase
MIPIDGLVVAIYGPWGSGKTTVLNFIEHYLKSAGEPKSPEVIYFNPWWFSGSENLVRDFFGQLINSLRPRDRALKKVRKILASVCETLEKTPITNKDPFGAIAKWIRPAEPNVVLLREKLEKLLRTQERRFVIFIDDIDRLTADEIRDIFKTVKAVANLPNIIYVLAFDRDVVTKALSEVQEDTGEKYLEKIVQVPFELPLPDKSSIRSLLFERLGSVLGEVDESIFDRQYWANIYFDGIDPLIETPRDINRLCNATSVSFPVVRGEVNPVDFIAIDALRVFVPTIYHKIRANPESFTGSSERTPRGSEDSERQFHNGYIEQIDKSLQEAIKNLLQRLFPRLQAVWARVGTSSSFEAQWRRELRVCSGDVFPVYFRLELAEGSIRAQDVKEFLEIANDQNKVAGHLSKLAGQTHPSGITRARALLERLEDYTSEHIPTECIKPILLALFDTGDEMRAAEPDSRGFYDLGVDFQIGRIIYQLIKRLSEAERFSILTEAANNGKSLATIVREVSFVRQMQEKRDRKEPSSDEEQLVTPEHLGELESLAVERIAEEAKNSSLVSHIDLARIILCWKDWDKSKQCEAWLTKMKSEQGFIISLLTSMVSVTLSQGMGLFGLGDRVPRRAYRIDLNFVRQFVDPAEIKPIVSNALKGSTLSARERTALETFLKELEKPDDQTQ